MIINRNNIRDILSIISLVVVLLLTVVVLLAVWDVIDDYELFYRSVATLFVVIGSSVLITVAMHFITFDQEVEVVESLVRKGLFTEIRRKSLYSFIAVIAIFAFLAVASIWDVLNEDVLFKSFTSSAVLAFSIFLVILITLERDGKLNFVFKVFRNATGKISIWRVIALTIIILFSIPFLIGFISTLFL